MLRYYTGLSVEETAGVLGESVRTVYRDWRHARAWLALAAAGAALQNHDVADAARQLAEAPEELQDWEWKHLHGRLDDSSVVFAPRLWRASFVPGGRTVFPLSPLTTNACA
jgi:hypothetical protein